MKDYLIEGFAKATEKTTKTLKKRDKTGRLKPVRVEATEYRYYSQDQFNHFLGIS